jgi:hypothetical protein
MVQPIVGKAVLSDSLMQQQGILARFLIASGNHLFGKRSYREPCPEDIAAIGRYHTAITALLNKPWNLSAYSGNTSHPFRLKPAT